MSVCGPKVDILIYYRGVERPTLFCSLWFFISLIIVRLKALGLV